MRPAHPKISVLLPVWNEAVTLPTCLRSIERQTERDIECVVVDDGSTDGSLEIARQQSQRDPRFRLFSQPHSGLVETLRAGITRCRAPLIARMDADDWMHRDRLRLQAAALNSRQDLDLMGSLVRIFPRDPMKEGRRSYETWLNSLRSPDSIYRNRFVECPIAHPTWMVRRSALEAFPYRDRGWPEDYDLVLRILRRGPRVGTVEQRLVGWRDSPSRLSRNHPRYELSSFTACRAWHLSKDFLSGHREYILWGHGRTGRALRKALALHGHHPTRIVDIHPRRLGHDIRAAKVIAPSDLTPDQSLPIVASVAGLKPRQQIRAALDTMGFQECVDYVVAA